jgi:thiamine biosynthesis lipoprotein
MGTTYNVNYEGNINYQEGVDSVLVIVNSEVNTYDPNATISKFNQSETGIDLQVAIDDVESSLHPTRKHFIKNFITAKMIYEKTQGAFDPTVMPLVNYWGFGYTPKKPVDAVDTMKIDSLKSFIGMNKINYEGTQLKKSIAGVQLDFSALAKGYGVDEVGRYLESKGINNYMVEIGGEARTKGKNSKGEYWNMGVSTPDELARITALVAAIRLSNESIATSGNYRNFYEVNGMKYSHTINPKTGFPERNNLLSATIVAENCMLADALATACMVLGLEDAKKLVADMQNIEAYFIFSNQDGEMESYLTSGLKARVKAF